MPTPLLPDDILSELLDHFFHIDVDASPPRVFDRPTGRVRTAPRGPTPLGQSTALLLVSRAFHALVEPFIWRTLFVDRPADFVLFFAPKTGLLHAAGSVGSRRRGWVRELVLGRDAAIPLDISKIDSHMAQHGDEGLAPHDRLDFHVDLLGPELPNLRRSNLGHPAYLRPRRIEDEPGLQHLISLVLRLTHDWPWDRHDILSSFADLWSSLGDRNDALIAAFLAPLFASPRLVELRAPFVDYRGTLTTRLPRRALRAATGLRLVTLVSSERPHGPLAVMNRPEIVVPNGQAVQALKGALPENVKVEVRRTRWTETANLRRDLPQDERDEETEEEWRSWSWVKEDRTRWPFKSESLSRYHPEVENNEDRYGHL